MNERQTVLTNELINHVLRSRAADPDPHLLFRIAREVEATPQLRRWSAFGLVRPGLRLGAGLAVVVVVATLGIYLAASGAFKNVGHPSPTPQASRLFQAPFRYTIPADSGLRLVGMGAIGSGVEPLDSLAVAFTRDGAGGDRGLVVALPAGSRGIWCFGNGSDYMPDATPAGVLAGYRQWLGPEVGAIGAPTSTTLDGRSALTVRTPAGRCPTSHRSERASVAPEPGVLTLIEVEGVTVVVSVWGQTNAILDEWLPTATEFVETIHFIPREST